MAASLNIVKTNIVKLQKETEKNINNQYLDYFFSTGKHDLFDYKRKIPSES